ncbi:MAG: glutamine--fructose-6-phosphate transaminase (isomerizing) [Deltaproteobacteria bacterium]|nr:MAG: glutamine--fructose-6-phosphate transaminase (isomerizing) [Deltaproteobacteria bacterium]
MCGIVGYVGPEAAAPVLLEGLRRLEYRGYDSAGVAVRTAAGIDVVRCEGKLARLAAALEAHPLEGTLGIGHTRWATHGRPSEENAHPHTFAGISVVHNGIIENHLELREALREAGHRFSSETDTEIFAHLIAQARDDGATSLGEAVRRALDRVRGTYALAVIAEAGPREIVVAKNASPLVLGRGEGAWLVASDVPALLPYTREVIFLEEEELAVVREDGVEIEAFSGARRSRSPVRIDWSPVMAEKGGHKHFMHKEIHEQPRAIADTLRGRALVEEGDVALDEVRIGRSEAEGIDRVVIVACGTSWHAGLVGKFLIERLARIPVEVDLASEFRYREPVVDDSTLVVAISQSGETADTIAAMREGKARGARTLAIVNVVGSAIAREADDVLYTHAGPEIGVASTKCFTTQLAALTLVAVRLGRLRDRLSRSAAQGLLSGLLSAPRQVEAVLEEEAVVREVAHEVAGARDFLFLGRGIEFPIALEGALKLKEISYIHAEGYPAGEMKHGPIALIEEGLPVVVIATQGAAYEKVLGNLEEVRARGGRVIAVATRGDRRIEGIADRVLWIPEVPAEVEPIVSVIPLQLLAYHVADHRGTDVDQPRNLAKSVTVE